MWSLTTTLLYEFEINQSIVQPFMILVNYIYNDIGYWYCYKAYRSITQNAPKEDSNLQNVSRGWKMTFIFIGFCQLYMFFKNEWNNCLLPAKFFPLHRLSCVFSYNNRKDRMQINCLFLHFITTDIFSMTIWWPFLITPYILCHPFKNNNIPLWRHDISKYFNGKKEILHNPLW